MASQFKIGDIVWGKMKGFPAWPAKIIQPPAGTKAPLDKKKKLLFFFGSENHAWLPDTLIYAYEENKDKFTITSRVPKGFKEAQDAVDAALAKQGPKKNIGETQENSKPEQKHKKESVKEATSEKGSTKSASQAKKESIKEVTSEKDGTKSAGQAKKESIKAVTSENDGAKSASQAKKESIKEVTSGQDSGQSKGMRGRGKKTDRKQAIVSNTVPRTTTRTPAKTNEETENDMKSKSINLPPKKRPASSYLAVSPKRRAQEKISEANHNPDGSIPEFRTLDLTNAVMRSPGGDSKLTKVRESLAAVYDFEEDVSPQDIIATPMKIGFLGLGIMGSALVTNLLHSGHEVTVWNRTPSKCKDFVKEGALKANTAAEVVNTCDITFSCVADPPALRDLVFGNSGVLQAICAEKSYVDMSTIDVDTSSDINEAIISRGGRFLEAPMLSSRNNNDRPVILASGDKSLFDDCYSCFAAMGRKAIYLGDIGSATKMKHCLNLLTGTVMAGLAESLALAEKMELNTDDLQQIIGLSSVSCDLIKGLAPDMLQRNYNNARTKLQLVQKDFRLVVNMSDSVDQPLVVGASVNELFKKAKAKGYGEHDVAALYRAADL